ncbi:MAG: acetoin utilization protein [Bacteroidetes bacterium QH_10_64_19]|jgi:CBS domain-containing protein|nr:MAG: acetoin utilization protein [Bacteroidetes bacterium QH_10_64_19]PSQ73962.1 MAG: acetoin utilization protein [Bacteroidetes bacterium QH_9_64_21]PSQ79638.1 MAG: acetoin utilization protein [Bacteroidetes bacterium QS_1_63_11]
MKVREAIHPTTPALQTSDSVETALGLLMEHHVRHLPVVDDEGRLAGVISEDRLMDAEGADARVDSLLIGRPVSIPPEAHVFDAARTLVEHDLSTIPVANAEGDYLGVLRRHDVFDQFAQMLSTRQSGAILALEVDSRDYALAKLVHVIEQNEAKVLAVASESPETSTGKIRITLKLNIKDTTRVRHVLEHHGYHVVAAFGEEDGELEELVEEFVRYLEV